MVDKINKTKLRNKAKLDRAKKRWYQYLRHFWPLVPKFYFWKVDWVLRSATDQSGDFPNVS